MENLAQLLVILGTAVVLPISIVTMSLRHKRYKLDLEHRERMATKTNEPDNSLSSSELKDLIQQTVTAATLPLQNKVADLENELRTLKAATPVVSTLMESETDKSLGKTKTHA